MQTAASAPLTPCAPSDSSGARSQVLSGSTDGTDGAKGVRGCAVAIGAARSTFVDNSTVLAAHPVLRHHQPPRASFSHGVKRVAAGNLEDLAEFCLWVESGDVMIVSSAEGSINGNSSR